MPELTAALNFQKGLGCVGWRSPRSPQGPWNARLASWCSAHCIQCLGWDLVFLGPGVFVRMFVEEASAHTGRRTQKNSQSQGIVIDIASGSEYALKVSLPQFLTSGCFCSFGLRGRAEKSVIDSSVDWLFDSLTVQSLIAHSLIWLMHCFRDGLNNESGLMIDERWFAWLNASFHDDQGMTNDKWPLMIGDVVDGLMNNNLNDWLNHRLADEQWMMNHESWLTGNTWC